MNIQKMFADSRTRIQKRFEDLRQAWMAGNESNGSAGIPADDMKAGHINK